MLKNCWLCNCDRGIYYAKYYGGLEGRWGVGWDGREWPLGWKITNEDLGEKLKGGQLYSSGKNVSQRFFLGGGDDRNAQYMPLLGLENFFSWAWIVKDIMNILYRPLYRRYLLSPIWYNIKMRILSNAIYKLFPIPLTIS